MKIDLSAPEKSIVVTEDPESSPMYSDPLDTAVSHSNVPRGKYQGCKLVPIRSKPPPQCENSGRHNGSLVRARSLDATPHAPTRLTALSLSGLPVTQPKFDPLVSHSKRPSSSSVITVMTTSITIGSAAETDNVRPLTSSPSSVETSQFNLLASTIAEYMQWDLLHGPSPPHCLLQTTSPLSRSPHAGILLIFLF
jgi:hypothetical protein